MIQIILPGLDSTSIEFIQSLEKAMDNTLSAFGFQRVTSSKESERTTLDYWKRD